MMLSCMRSVRWLLTLTTMQSAVKSLPSHRCLEPWIFNQCFPWKPMALAATLDSVEMISYETSDAPLHQLTGFLWQQQPLIKCSSTVPLWHCSELRQQTYITNSQLCGTFYIFGILSKFYTHRAAQHQLFLFYKKIPALLIGAFSFCRL